MNPSGFKEEFEASLKANETFTFFCECEIEYSGRAESFLSKGDRVIIVKSDNTMLIHQPNGSKPINYMKEDSQIQIEENQDGLLIKSYNSSYKDYLDVHIYDVYDYMAKKLYDGKDLVLAGDEEDMSDMIRENPDLISQDFKPLSREEHTKYGFIDVFGHDDQGRLVIVECKRYKAGLSAIQQLRRYVEKMKKSRGLDSSSVKGIMAAPDITDNAEGMLDDWGFTYVSVTPPKRLERYKKNQKSILDY